MRQEYRKLPQLENLMGYHFHDRNLLIQAMTHSSFANENRMGRDGSNERLEFLGDAVLETISSEYLYRHNPELPEGELTKKRASLVCEPTLAMCARLFHLQDYILLGKGEEQTGGRTRDSILSDATEALIGAIYLDGGFASAKEFVLDYLLKDSDHMRLFYDSKTILQEIVQESGKVANYRLVGEEGPDHNKIFLVEVYIDGKLLGSGQGHTKKAAEQEAAHLALKVLGYEEPGQ